MKIAIIGKWSTGAISRHVPEPEGLPAGKADMNIIRNRGQEKELFCKNDTICGAV
jgi:hypothetical protein